MNPESSTMTQTASVTFHHEGYGVRRSVYKNIDPSHPAPERQLERRPAMYYLFGTLATCTAVFVYIVLRRLRKPSAIKDVPGPPNPSWIFGMFHRENLTPPTSCGSIALNVRTFQDTYGISWSKKLEE